MTQRSLQKWHGAGNDFLVDVTTPEGASWWNPERALALCDRHRGVGADGLLVAALGDDVVTMTLFNADGSLAEMSGNGIRCLVAAVQRSSGDHRSSRRVSTATGVREVAIQVQGDHRKGSVSMGAVTLLAPLPGALGVASVGNPHVVVRDNASWNTRDREDLAEKLSTSVGGANVEFVTVTSRRSVDICVVERGVGWTLACGTGSVAVVKVLFDLGEVDDCVVVTNPGGDLEVTLQNGEATLAGPVAFVADVTWDVS